MKAIIKRSNRSYKVKDNYYHRAMRRAKKEDQKLVQVIELCVMAYGEKGHSLFYCDEEGNKQVITGANINQLKTLWK